MKNLNNLNTLNDVKTEWNSNGSYHELTKGGFTAEVLGGKGVIWTVTDSQGNELISCAYAPNTDTAKSLAEEFITKKMGGKK